MTKPQVAYLLDRISAVAQVLGATSAPDHWHDEDLSDVALEVATFLRGALDVPALEHELVSRSQVDAKTLTEVTAWFSSVAQETPPPFAMTFPDGTTFAWDHQLRAWGWPSRSNLRRDGSQGIDRIAPT